MAAPTFADVLTWTIGDTTIGENLQRALATGAVLQRDDGTFELPRQSGEGRWIQVAGGERLPNCQFGNALLFEQIYAKAAVPQSCSTCFKVKVSLRTLRELVAAYKIASAIPCTSKWGIDFYNRHSRDVYAGYFYVTGLDGARALFPLVRTAIDRDPLLGPDLPVVIKRGCSEFEAALGPSSDYTFRPELRAIEDHFARRFRPSEPKPSQNAALLFATILFEHWVPFAFQSGDDTYLDFTNGQPLYRRSVSYDPLEPG